ncbi:MAG TPA: SUMF1/EgtB/PvdO family nonheme iron enzyme [Vicinamibacteria bacterium]|nr:SUMF1/EgtB/PvdO family nonheme iron enzyme [Vicinamibacteria bacterium]
MTLERLREAWRRSDRVLALLSDGAWLEQPIPLRQPFLFYLGHLPAFAWNHVGRGLLGRRPFSPELDRLFERGIDPVGVDAYVPKAAWPERAAVLGYRDRVRRELEEALSDPAFPRQGEPVVAMVVEHELMHHETLLYMIQELDHGLKASPGGWSELPEAAGTRPARAVEVAEGDATLGAAPGSLPFAWDNELPECRVRVPPFAIDDRPVTNADLLEFVRDGGYAEPRLWREDDWAWRLRQCVHQPRSWRRDGDGLRVRSLREDVPFERAAAWPAMVSWAEASAYARWREARLPTEAEWHRAACGTPSGDERPLPWGDEAPGERHGSFHFRHASPVPVGAFPAGASAWGVHELVGNGWEWTGTPFAPFPGFAPMPRYPGYSADFFDGRHFVLLGASWATDEALVRTSFRNWFQPHYPYVFSKFRCARSL